MVSLRSFWKRVSVSKRSDSKVDLRSELFKRFEELIDAFAYIDPLFIFRITHIKASMLNQTENASLSVPPYLQKLTAALGFAQSQSRSLQGLITSYIRNNPDDFPWLHEEPLHPRLVLQAAADIFRINLKVDDFDDQFLSRKSDTAQLIQLPVQVGDSALVENIPATIPLQAWRNGFVTDLVNYNTELSGGWCLLRFGATVDTLLALDHLSALIGTFTGKSLARFFELRIDQALFLFIKIKHGNSRRIRFTSRFDVAGQRPEMWRFRGSPHEKSTEWNVATRTKLEKWGPFDHRTSSTVKSLPAKRKAPSEYVYSPPSGREEGPTAHPSFSDPMDLSIDDQDFEVLYDEYYS